MIFKFNTHQQYQEKCDHIQIHPANTHTRQQKVAQVVCECKFQQQTSLLCLLFVVQNVWCIRSVDVNQKSVLSIVCGTTIFCNFPFKLFMYKMKMCCGIWQMWRQLLCIIMIGYAVTRMACLAKALQTFSFFTDFKARGTQFTMCKPTFSQKY